MIRRLFLFLAFALTSFGGHAALSPSQMVSLRAACLADGPCAAFFASPGDAAGLKVYFNAASSPAWIAWRSKVTKDEIMLNGFDWTRMDNLSVGKYRVWVEMFDNEFRAFNPSKPNIRAGIDAVWVGTQADLDVRAVVYTHCKRTATRAEKMLGSGTGSTAVPGLMAFEGEISDADAAQLIYKDDGTIWTL